VSRIIVCGVDHMPRAVAALGPKYVVSLLPPDQQPPTPPTIAPAHHHRVEIHDVTGPMGDAIVPTREHVATLVEFLRRCDPDAAVLIHCAAGISRSPAAALIALALDHPGREDEAGRVLRSVAPHTMPNSLLLALADEVLGRDGALLAAGRWEESEDWAVVTHFELPRRLPVDSVAT
jgi:predicted protein tyrosine phosphatase